MADPVARQMYKQRGSSFLALNYESSSDSYAKNGWSVIWNTFPYAVNRSFIDLSGYTRQELTTFTQGVDIQGSTMLRSGTQGIPEIMCLDILSTRRITDAEISNWGLPGVTNDPPGFLNNTLDLMEVVYGERTTFAQNNNILNLSGAMYVILEKETFGSGNPSASDRLHWTRCYWMNGAGALETLYLPATNLVVQAVTAEEKDLVYIERLRRSYTQQRTET